MRCGIKPRSGVACASSIAIQSGVAPHARIVLVGQALAIARQAQRAVVVRQALVAMRQAGEARFAGTTISIDTLVTVDRCAIEFTRAWQAVRPIVARHALVAADENALLARILRERDVDALHKPWIALAAVCAAVAVRVSAATVRVAFDTLGAESWNVCLALATIGGVLPWERANAPNTLDAVITDGASQCVIDTVALLARGSIVFRDTISAVEWLSKVLLADADEACLDRRSCDRHIHLRGTSSIVVVVIIIIVPITHSFALEIEVFQCSGVAGSRVFRHAALVGAVRIQQGLCQVESVQLRWMHGLASG
jgi:hypothetical protein